MSAEPLTNHNLTTQQFFNVNKMIRLLLYAMSSVESFSQNLT